MFNVRFSVRETFPVAFSPPTPFTAEFEPTIYKPIGDYYEGPYEFTPSAEEQTIPILGMVATDNITVKPIPNNYGLITWNGSTLTVS